ncbi:MAG: hypothetical protein P9M00_04815 [Candidatus Tritonobacter lacicola]|nr:hypothetical protein [Candidatus Tritonobacter lacicola]
MKGLILTLIWFVIFLTVTIVILRLRRRKKPFKFFMAVFIGTLPLFIFSYLMTPTDLYFLPSSFVEPCAIVDFLYGLVVYVLLFHNFWDFVYAGPMGFSAGLLVELERVGGRGGSTEELIAYFRRDGQVDKIFGRRIPNLLHGGYIAMDNEVVRLTRKGRVMANLTCFLKRLVCAGEGG